MRKWLFFTFVAFVMAMIHACSLNNSVIKPNCQIFQYEMADKWWTPAGGGTTGQMYFSASGAMKTKTGTDSISYSIQNCNSLVWYNHTSGESKQWLIKDLDPQKMVLQTGPKETVTYISGQ